MTYNCELCKKEILEGEQVYQLNMGSINKDELGGMGFDETPSCSVHGCVHIKCLFEKEDNTRNRKGGVKNEKEV